MSGLDLRWWTTTPSALERVQPVARESKSGGSRPQNHRTIWIGGRATNSADLVTTSGSGMDPHITIEAARFQTPRVTGARGLSTTKVESLIEECTEISTLPVFGGERVVNVLKLNIAGQTSSKSADNSLRSQ
ncbi:MAG: potassium-transporting ATPase subunit C [Phycisphaerae bacterium]